jgi:predicted dehydrogenase
VKVDAFGEHLRVFSNNNKSLDHHFFGNDMDFGLILDFIDCVKEGRAPSITGFDGLKSLEVALAAYESSKLRKTVCL